MPAELIDVLIGVPLFADLDQRELQLLGLVFLSVALICQFTAITNTHIGH